MASDVIMLPMGDGAGKKIHKTLYQTTRKALVFASGATVKKFTIDATAETTRIILETPTFASATVTMTLSIENRDSVEIFSNSGMIENDDHVMVTDTPLVGENTIKLTASTDPLSDGTCYVSIYLKGN